MAFDDDDDDVQGIAALSDPVRRALYRYVAAAPAPVSRDDAATATGTSRATAAFHLDRLVADGLLRADYRRLSGRSGPGAGRPAKLYERAQRDIAVTLPPRSYDVAGDLLAHAIQASMRTGVDAASAVTMVARERGRAFGEAVRTRAGRRPSRRALVRATADALTDHGFEPRVDRDDITLANCPFHRLAQDHTELVCGMNHALLGGVCDAVGDGVLAARLDPAPDRCCVRLVIEHPSSRRS